MKKQDDKIKQEVEDKTIMDTKAYEALVKLEGYWLDILDLAISKTRSACIKKAGFKDADEEIAKLQDEYEKALLQTALRKYKQGYEQAIKERDAFWKKELQARTEGYPRLKNEIAKEIYKEVRGEYNRILSKEFKECNKAHGYCLTEDSLSTWSKADKKFREYLDKKFPSAESGVRRGKPPLGVK